MSSSVSARDSPIPVEDVPDVFGPGSVLTAGRVHMKVTNWGSVGNFYRSLSNDPGGQWPNDSGVEYLHGIGLAVGAVWTEGLQTHRRVSFLHEWGPGSLDPEDRIYESAEGMAPGIRFFDDDGDYDSDDPFHSVDEEFVDGRDDDGDGLIDEDHAARGSQLFTAVMRDDGLSIDVDPHEPHQPIGLECRQSAWAYAVEGYSEFCVIEYVVTNRSSATLDSVTLGWKVDMDVGPAALPGFTNDDFDLPGFPNGDFEVPVDSLDPRFQFPHFPHPTTGHPDSALCPRMTMRVRGFSMADDNGDLGQTPGIASFLLVDHSTDPAGLIRPAQVGFKSFRSFIRGAASGEPVGDLERFGLMTGGEGIDPATGLISVAPGGAPGNYVQWCSIGPFRNLGPGESVTATIAFAVAQGNYQDASQYAIDHALYQAGGLSLGDLTTQHQPLANALNVMTAFAGDHVQNDLLPETDFHGRETPLKRPSGAPPIFMQDCRDIDQGTQRLVNSLDYTWFDLDCDFCTGVWDFASARGLLHRPWIAAVTPPFGLVAVGDDRPRSRVLAVAPNPTQLGSSIEFQLARPATVEIEVRDVAGRAIRTLTRADFAAGAHRAEWNGRDDRGTRVMSGVYFISVRIDGVPQVRKVVLVR